MRSPARSKRSLIAPVRSRRVASGLMIDRVRSTAMALFSAGERVRGYSGPTGRQQPASSLLFPPRRGLLPVGQRVAGGVGRPPAAAGGLDGVGVAAVEQVEAAGEIAEVGGLDPIDEEQHGRAVGVVVAVRQEDRLRLGVAVALRS